MIRPEETECAPYYRHYIDRIEGNDIISVLEKQNLELLDIMDTMTDDKAAYVYAPGKWSVKELLGHIVDSERIFGYRTLCIARGEKVSLPGFDQDNYIKETNYNDRSISSLAEEFKNLRAANIILINSFSENDLNKKGTANNCSLTVRALLFIIAGHVDHHIDILKTRYLN